MQNKYLIIAVTVLLVISLVGGYGLKRSFEFFEHKFNTISSLGRSILKVNGMDFDTRVDYYLPTVNAAEQLGNYLDPDTNTVKSVSVFIKSKLPSWLLNTEDKSIQVKVFPTFFSVDFVYGTRIEIGSLPGPATEHTAFSKAYCVRLNIIIPNNIANGVTNSVNIYDVFLFYSTVDRAFMYYVTLIDNEIGQYTTKLTSYDQYKLHPEKESKLSYIGHRRLVNYVDTSLSKYAYDNVANVQNTGVYLDSAFDYFLKGL